MHNPEKLKLECESVQVLSDLVHILSELFRCKLPEESISIQTAFGQFSSFWLLYIRLNALLFNKVDWILWRLALLALYAFKVRIKSGVIVCTLAVDPPSAFVTQNPLLSIIAWIEVNLFAVETISLFFVLDHTFFTKLIRVKCVKLVIKRLHIWIFILRANFVNA